MTEPIKINKEYLREHYIEMMSVDDAPLPLFPLSAFCPEMKKEMVKSVKDKGLDSVYSHLKLGHYDQEGETYIQTSMRLIKEYIEKHPEHSNLIILN